MRVVTQLFREEVGRLFTLAAHNIPGEGRMDQHLERTKSLLVSAGVGEDVAHEDRCRHSIRTAAVIS